MWGSEEEDGDCTGGEERREEERREIVGLWMDRSGPCCVSNLRQGWSVGVASSLRDNFLSFFPSVDSFDH